MMDKTPNPASRVVVALEALPLALLLLAGIYWLAGREPAPEIAWKPAPAAPSPDLQPVGVTDSEELRSIFDAYGYAWPPTDVLPRLAVASLPGDLADQSTAERKGLFLRSLLPLVLAENELIRRERRLLERLVDHAGDLTATEKSELDQIRKRYAVEGSLSEPAVQARLKARVDVIPPALALAQAAIETGWGTSRFALEGNNLFGEWTWNAEHGLEPRQRKPGTRHYVRRFPGLRASVRAYMRNLNTHQAYAGLREQRRQARSDDQAATAQSLAGGLARYSERGPAYVRDVRDILRQNQLDAITAAARLRGSER
jgi:Bax protein